MMSFVAYLIPVYSTLVVLVYISFLYVFTANYTTEFRKYPFYLFVPVLAVGDISVLLIYCLYFPIYRYLDGQIDYYVGQLVHWANGTFITVYISLLVALNRFCALVLPNINDRFFSARPIKKTILGTLLFWMLQTAYSRFVINCDLEFDVEDAHTEVNCNTTSPSMIVQLSAVQKQTLFMLTGVLVPFYCGLLILLLYLGCFIFLVHQRLTNKSIDPARNLEKIGQERRLLYQGGCIGLSLVIADLVFVLSKWLPQGTIAMTLISNAVVTPLTFILFNKAIRECYLRWLGFTKKSVQIQIQAKAETAKKEAIKMRKKTSKSMVQNYVHDLHLTDAPVRKHSPAQMY